jgi:hypothetical protein
MSKKASKNQRELKVYTKYAFSRYGKATVLPEIRLKGNWVREFGFECGNTIEILKVDKNLIIRNAKNVLEKIRL